MSYGRASAQHVKEDRRTEIEILASTRKTLAEADEISTHTLVTLDHQTEQLRGIQKDAEAIDHNLDQSEYLLARLKPFGWVRKLFKKDPTANSYQGAAITSSDSRSVAPTPSHSHASHASHAHSSHSSSGAARISASESARRSAGGKAASGDARLARPSADDDELDAAYDDISRRLDSLQNKSHDINRTLKQHNQLLPEIGESVDRDQERMKKQQRDMKKKIGK